MDLFVSWIICHFYAGYADEFLESDLLVEVCVEKVEDWPALSFGYVVLGFH